MARKLGGHTGIPRIRVRALRTRKPHPTYPIRKNNKKQPRPVPTTASGPTTAKRTPRQKRISNVKHARIHKKQTQHASPEWLARRAAFEEAKEAKKRLRRWKISKLKGETKGQSNRICLRSGKGLKKGNARKSARVRKPTVEWEEQDDWELIVEWEEQDDWEV